VNISATAKTEGTVLVVDDANIMRATCQRALERSGYQVLAAESGEEALKLLQEKPAEVAVLDIRMPGMSGIDLLKEIKTRWPATEVVMMTAYADTAVAEESLHLGATAFLIKPFEHITILLDTVKKCMSRIRIRQGEIAEDGPLFEDILRQSGLVTEEQFVQARAIAEKGGFTLRQALTVIKVLAPKDIDWAIANSLDVPYVRLTDKMLDPDLIRGFPASLAHAYTCLPLFRSENELHVVIANPFHPQATAAIEKEMQVQAVLSKGSESEIRQFITRYYGPAPEQSLSQLLSNLQDDKTPDREKLLLELLRRTRLEKLGAVQVRPLGPDQWEFQISGRLKTPAEK